MDQVQDFLKHPKVQKSWAWTRFGAILIALVILKQGIDHNNGRLDHQGGRINRLTHSVDQAERTADRAVHQVHSVNNVREQLQKDIAEAVERGIQQGVRQALIHFQ